MSFTQSAFIRKNTPELRKKLMDLGYKVFPNFIYFPCLSCSNGYAIPADNLNRDGKFDCKNNEDLFLALTALRDDSDYMQWFTDGKEFILCDREDWGDMISSLCSAGRYNYDKNGELSNKFKKATINELIEHFKDES